MGYKQKNTKNRLASQVVVQNVSSAPVLAKRLRLRVFDPLWSRGTDDLDQASGENSRHFWILQAKST
jgi:hypothetical protein